MHQAGIENVVSSSGTALTSGQIRLISRFTKNVTILYDGDSAGIKAALRGTDLLLKEGLNVKVLLFEDGEDPDSYIRKNGSTAMQRYLEDKEEDFVFFKTRVLLAEAKNDPIKRAETIREVVESIALIPDEIKVSVFIRECSQLLDIEERVLLSELNKMRIKERQKLARSGDQDPVSGRPTSLTRTESPEETPFDPQPLPEKIDTKTLQEREFVRVLLTYGQVIADWDDDSGLPVAPLLINSIKGIPIEDTTAAAILAIYQGYIDQQKLPEDRVFTSHLNPEIAGLAISLLSSKYTLSPKWQDDKRNIHVSEERDHLKELVYTTVYRMQKRHLEQKISGVREQIKNEKNDQDIEILITEYQKLQESLKILAEKLGTIVLK